MNREQAVEKRQSYRERGAAEIEAEIEAIDTRRKGLKVTLARLRQPVDVDALVRRANDGKELTQTELAELAAEAPDVFNARFERGAA